MISIMLNHMIYTAYLATILTLILTSMVAEIGHLFYFLLPENTVGHGHCISFQFFSFLFALFLLLFVIILQYCTNITLFLSVLMVTPSASSAGNCTLGVTTITGVGVLVQAEREVGRAVFGSRTFTVIGMLHFQKYQRSQNLCFIISMALTTI